MTPAPYALTTRLSAPVPWPAEAVALRATKALPVRLDRRHEPLRRAFERPQARNRVATGRVFAALEAALRPDIAPQRYEAARHQAFVASALTPLRCWAANDNEPLGIGMRQVACVSGKHLDRRDFSAPLQVGLHAQGRFVERSGLGPGLKPGP